MSPNGKKWLDALRSGEFRKYNNALCQVKDGQFMLCALGVACELYRREHPDRARWSKVEARSGYNEFTFNKFFVVLDWLGLTVANADAVIHLNDVADLPFEEIATRIEAEGWLDRLDPK